jgi:streptomycin 6-kinase
MLNYPNLRNLLKRRIEQLSEELNFDGQKIHSWAVYQAVLSALWGFEDFKSLDRRWLAVAEILSEIKI